MEMTYSFKLYDLNGVKVRFFDFAIERIKRNKHDIVFDLDNIEKWINPQRPFMGIILTKYGSESCDKIKNFWQTLRDKGEQVTGACIIKRYSDNSFLFYIVDSNIYHDTMAEALGLYEINEIH